MTPDKRRLCFDLALWIGTTVVTLALLATEALAERTRPLVENQAWRAECGSCHVAYPPVLLSAEQWRAQMASLEQHYGTDASVDATAVAEIGTFLERNAGRDRRTASPGADPPRITASAWFVKEHRKVRTSDWTSTAVKSAANCGACHPGADRGSFDEQTVRVPR